MPAKRPAPKATRGKKAAAARTVVRKPAHKPAERAKVAAVQARKSIVTPKKAPSHRPEPMNDDTPREPLEAPSVATSAPAPSAASAEPETPPPVRSVTSSDTSSLSSSAAVSDDDSDVEPGSLLAGPRNVKPYIAKRGEQYMSKEQLEHFRQILLNWKRDLMEEVDRTVSHMKDEAANFPDPNDRATQEEEFSLELRTRDRERKLIRKIDEALKRVEDGTYGYCLETGEEIGIKRLEARPVATLCLEAQERRERRERQYGDRDDRYR
jgi:DnaK suppressor protein